MKNSKPFFEFDKRERNGLFYLLLIIGVLQLGFFLMRSYPTNKSPSILVVDTEVQAQMDLLREKALNRDSTVIYPFNPNYITDYKGYTLGMSPDQIDRLLAFRKRGNYVNSAKEFQEVTLVSDSLLRRISPFFKFPDWINTKGKQNRNDVTGKHTAKIGLEVKDLNKATAEDLQSVFGIGDKLSQRIVKFRDCLNGFLVNEQLYDVYGLKPEVVERALKRFRVMEKPKIEKININTATIEEMSQLIYLHRKVASEIEFYRTANGGIDSFEELRNIPGFPSNKIDRIVLYLSL